MTAVESRLVVRWTAAQRWAVVDPETDRTLMAAGLKIEAITYATRELQRRGGGILEVRTARGTPQRDRVVRGDGFRGDATTRDTARPSE
jgi:hypothetical protein